jgi:hypothetical protein
MTRKHVFKPTEFDHLESREVLSTFTPVPQPVALIQASTPPFHHPIHGTGVNTGPGNIGPGNPFYYGHRGVFTH